MSYATRVLSTTLLVLAGGCANSVTPSGSTGSNATVSSSTGSLPPNTYVLDFRAMGGLEVGNLRNLAFTVELDHATRTFDLGGDFQLQTGAPESPYPLEVKKGRGS